MASLGKGDWSIPMATNLDGQLWVPEFRADPYSLYDRIRKLDHDKYLKTFLMVGNYRIKFLNSKKSMMS